MADGKQLSLNFTVKSDNNGFKEINDQIEKLSKSASALKDSLRGIQIGKEAHTNHPDSVHSSIKKVSSELVNATKEADKFAKTLSQETQKAVSQSQSHIQRFVSFFGGAMGRAGYTGSGIYQNPPPPGGGGGGGQIPGLGPVPRSNGIDWAKTVSGGLNALSGGMNVAGQVASMAGAGVSFYSQYLQNEKMNPLRNLVRAQSGMNQTIGMYRNGPLGYMQALMESPNLVATGKAGSAVDGVIQGSGPVRDKMATGGAMMQMTDEVEDLRTKQAGGLLGNIGGMFKNAAKMAAGAAMTVGGAPGGVNIGMNGMTGIAGNASDMAMTGQSIRQGGIQAIQGEQQAEIARLLAQTAPGMTMRNFFEAGSGSVGLRAAGSRALGGAGNAASIFGQGGAMGFTMDQSLGIGAGMASQFGGRAAMNFTGQAMGLANQGFDLSSAGGILGKMNEAGSNGGQMMAKIMAQGVKEGMSKLDVQFFQKIGEAVAQGSVGAYGSTGDIAAGMLTQGLGAKPTMRDVNSRISGLDLLNQTQQSNPFFSSRNLVDASTILGGGAAIEESEALAGASFQDLSAMASGKAKDDNLLSIMGVSPEQAGAAKSQRISRIGSVLTGGEGKAAKFLQGKMKESGGSFEKMLQSALEGGDKKTINTAAAMGFTRLGGGDMDSFRGMMADMGAMGENAMAMFNKGRGGVGSVMDKNAQENISLQVSRTLSDIGKYLAILSKMDENRKPGSPSALQRAEMTREQLESSAATAGYGATEATNEAIRKFGVNAEIASDNLEKFAGVLSSVKGIMVSKSIAKINEAAENERASNRGSKMPVFPGRTH